MGARFDKPIVANRDTRRAVGTTGDKAFHEETAILDLSGTARTNSVNRGERSRQVLCRDGQGPRNRKESRFRPLLACSPITRLVMILGLAIQSFAGRAIERLHSRNDARGVDPSHVRRLQAILSALDGPEPLRSLARPTYRLHRLHGPRADDWSVRVSQGWRVTFRMNGPDVCAVRYENYHH